MPKKSGRTKREPPAKRGKALNQVAAGGLILALVSAGTALALLRPARPSLGTTTVPAAIAQTQNNFAPGSPSKEYIYAGGRLVATEEPSPALPSAPTILRTLSDRYIGWTDNSNNETGFKIERSASSTGPWEQAGLVGPDVVVFKIGLGYYLRVKATAAAGDSAPSNVINHTWEIVEWPWYYEVTGEFSATQNPSGAWSYGYQNSAGAPFVLFVNNNNIFGLETGLTSWYLPNAWNLPAIIHNGTGVSKSYYGATHPPNLINLFPGTSTQRSVLRWRAQRTGTIKIEGRFEGLDATTTDVTITHNLSASLFGANVNGFGSRAPFSVTREVVAGDTVEFTVGNGNGDLSHDSTGLSVAITVQAPPSVTYNAVQEFSPTQNQTGAWSYGYRSGTTFAMLPNNNNVFGLEAGLHTWYLPNAFNLPAVIHNGTGVTKSYYGATHPPDLLNLFPGASGEKAVVRWTAPQAGTARIGGRFQGLDAATTDVAVTHNGASVFGGNISGLGNQAPFTLTRTVAAGDTIEFQVGYGNGTVSSDSTGLAVAITLQ